MMMIDKESVSLSRANNSSRSSSNTEHNNNNKRQQTNGRQSSMVMAQDEGRLAPDEQQDFLSSGSEINEPPNVLKNKLKNIVVALLAKKKGKCSECVASL